MESVVPELFACIRDAQPKRVEQPRKKHDNLPV